MGQIQKTTKKEESESLSESMKKVQEEPVEKFRQVELEYESCCGCGCYGYTIRRTVPMDSDLQDGDVVHSLEPGDEEL